MQDVNQLLEELERGGVMSEAIRAAWGRFLHLRGNQAGVATAQARDRALDEAVMMTREVLLQVLEDSGKAIAHLVSTTSHGFRPSALPPKVTELYDRAAWATQLCTNTPLLMRADQVHPLIESVFSYLPSHLLRQVVAMRCERAGR